MHEVQSLGLIVDIVIIITACLLFGVIANKLKQSVIPAYILVGIMMGPNGFGLINKVEEISSLAEIGVALLMFVIGVEFKFSTLSRVWKISIIGGAFQVIAMVAIGFFMTRVVGYSYLDSIIVGMIIAISSTMIVVKILSEKGETENLHGQILIGWLIVQDMAAVIMIFFISNFSRIATGSILDLLLVLAGGLALVAFIIIVGRKLLPMVMHLIIRTGNKEMFLLSVLVAAIGVSVSTYLLGISIALGAFIVGFMLSEAECNLEIAVQIKPFRDIFVVLFFVSVGMFIDPRTLTDNPHQVIAVVALIVFGKFITCSIPTWLLGCNGKTAVKVGMSMLQIGEFSFIMLTLGQQYGFISPSVFSAIITASLITIVLTPLAMGQSERIHKLLIRLTLLEVIARFLSRYKVEETEEVEPASKGLMIICGFGRSGSRVAKELRNNYDITIVDHDPRRIKELKQEGYHYVFGDAINHHVLIKAKVMRANFLVLALPGLDVKKLAIRYAKVYNPEIVVVARGHDEDEKQELLKVGANEVIVPHTVEAVEIVRRILS
ncbi:MAG: cation:proton antiporter [Candidatus Brocadiales bacterium]